jgi:CBS domain-containing protein
MNRGLRSVTALFQKNNLGLATNQTVASLARPVSPLTLDTMLPRVIETLRQSTLDRYPVVAGDRLIWLLSKDELSSVLMPLSADDQERFRTMTLASVLDKITASSDLPTLLYAGTPVGKAIELFDAYPAQPVIGVVNGNGSYFGVLTRGDLLALSFRTLAPARVGGMATPLGVYLTDGIDSGGVGSLGLILAGSTMTILMFAVIIGSSWVYNVGLLHHFDPVGWLTAPAGRHLPLAGVQLIFDIESIIPLILVLMSFRLLPVAGYHAAEHQVVHCIERGEPLVPERVAAMPRPHPRCGTNLVVGLVILIFLSTFFGDMFNSYSVGIVPALIVTFLIWRPVGTFMQQYFTTRKASPKQLASGIRAGEDLLHRYRTNPNRVVKLPMRIWRMGLLQVIAGSIVTFYLLLEIVKYIPQLAPYMQGFDLYG